MEEQVVRQFWEENKKIIQGKIKEKQKALNKKREECKLEANADTAKINSTEEAEKGVSHKGTFA